MRTSVILIVFALFAVASSAAPAPRWQHNPKQHKPEADAISGEWDVALTMQDNPLQLALRLKLEGDKVRGSFEPSHLGDGSISDGSWANNKLKITVETRHGTLELTGELRDGKLAGEWDMGDRHGKWEAKKKDPAAKGA